MKCVDIKTTFYVNYTIIFITIQVTMSAKRRPGGTLTPREYIYIHRTVFIAYIYRWQRTFAIIREKQYFKKRSQTMCFFLRAEHIWVSSCVINCFVCDFFARPPNQTHI